MTSRWLAGLALVAGSLVLAAQERPAPGLDPLQRRAQEILRHSQNNEISMTEARRQVQLLLKDLKKWSEASDAKLVSRTRTFTTPAVGRGEYLTADRCPLFFQEELERLCPLDFTRSEVWGASVVFCRYLCAPEIGS